MPWWNELRFSVSFQFFEYAHVSRSVDAAALNFSSTIHDGVLNGTADLQVTENFSQGIMAMR